MRSSPARASRAAARSSTRARSARWKERPPDAGHEPGDPRAGRLRRLRGDLEGPEHPAHAADVGHERQPRHSGTRRPNRARPRARRGLPDQAAAGDRDRLRDDQRRRRLPGHRPHAGDVQGQAGPAQRRRAGQGAREVILASFLHDPDFIYVLYIISFSLFIYGLSGLTGPRTAVRGNRIAAVGMGIALVATLLIDGMHNWALIVVGIVIGTIVGVPAARNVKMTAMPQMVALFNGVGGGAVALISLVEFREGEDIPLESLIPIVLAAIIGSISFWGSNIAFSKLQELKWAKRRFPARPLTIANIGLAIVIAALALIIIGGADQDILFWLLLIAAGVLGITAVLPIGGADMPVVISTLNAFTGLSAAAAGVALDNTALIVAGMIVGASG